MKTVIQTTPELSRAIGRAIVTNHEGSPDNFPCGNDLQRVVDRLRMSMRLSRPARFVADALDERDVEMLIRALVRVATLGGPLASEAASRADKLCKFKGLSIVDFIGLTAQA